ncbi:MAG: aldo/keto reductase [Rhodospirillales bacterium]|nr:aldo/keto reductase [Rhodospirillales bacterium]MBO6786956.1 aldo/keto reductase [Rhodospirillales bacterium]
MTEDTTGKVVGATAAGTQRFADRFAPEPGQYRDVLDLHWSSVGIGTYLGDADDKTDEQVTAAVCKAVAGGINVIDTAANYRRGRGEVSVGKAIRAILAAGDATRDELIVCTKAGYLPTPADVFKETYLGRDGIGDSDLVGGNHCIHPSYIRDRIGKSLDALGCSRIDVFYLHNPEAQLAHVDRGEFDKRLAAAFEVLEQEVAAGRIGCYGLATWRAFRASPGQQGYISIAGAKALAKRAAGSKPDHLKCVQMPLSITMPEAIERPTQWIGDASVSPVAAARVLGLAAVASGSIGQGKVPKINESLTKWLGEDLADDCRRALQFTRSASGLTSALVGMKQPAHVDANLEVQQRTPLPRTVFELMFRKTQV